MCMYFVYLFRFIYFTNKLTDRPHDRKKGLTQPPNQTANLMYKYSIIYIIDIYIYIYILVEVVHSQSDLQR